MRLRKSEFDPRLARREHVNTSPEQAFYALCMIAVSMGQQTSSEASDSKVERLLDDLEANAAIEEEGGRAFIPKDVGATR